MVPAAVVGLERFPLTTSGKIDRRALPAPSGERDASGYVAPRDPVELQVARIWEDVLGTRPIGLHDGFFDLGGHSLLVLRLMSEIERRFGQDLPMAAIFQGATVERFAHMLRQGYRRETGAHLVEIRAGTSGSPVFFAHPAGSEVVCYMPFARSLEPEDRPLYAIAPPPLVDGKLPFASFEERAAAYAGLIRQVQPHGPYTLAGWCYGGSNAFAVARHLEDEGEDVSLTLIDTHAPIYVPPEEEPGRAPIVEALAVNLMWDYTADQKPLTELEQMGGDEQIDYLLDLARRGDYLPPDAGRPQMQAMLDLWVANLHLLWRYRPTPLAGRLTLVRADAEDPELYTGWEALAGGDLEVHMVEGNHYTIMREPRVRGVAAVMNGTARP
jgi:thioesterase domain-containing protein/acyl carrier protein